MDSNQQCRSCHGIGLHSDDEGWQYTCSVCHGSGKKSYTSTRLVEVDETNRVID